MTDTTTTELDRIVAAQAARDAAQDAMLEAFDAAYGCNGHADQAALDAFNAAAGRWIAAKNAEEQMWRSL